MLSVKSNHAKCKYYTFYSTVQKVKSYKTQIQNVKTYKTQMLVCGL
ncbi:MAG: hypothetical protein K0R05_3692 [Anaerocolumna sp.]|jgi:hypothetical protein|nr:hypothetical protein [Anaerocolumna sp.]